MTAEISRVKQLEGISQELESLNYYNCAAVSERLQSIRDTFSNLQKLSDGRRERIQNGIVAQQKLDSMRLDFAKRAAVSLEGALHLEVLTASGQYDGALYLECN